MRRPTLLRPSAIVVRPRKRPRTLPRGGKRRPEKVEPPKRPYGGEFAGLRLQPGEPVGTDASQK